MLPWNPSTSLYSTPSNPGGSGPYMSQGGQQHLPQGPHHQAGGGDGQQQQANGQQQQQQQGPPGPPPLNLSMVMHYLQTEARRYSKDRNEWEIERAEMRARIALLEGEKRGNEGIVRDLTRRVRMLENALRGERSKFLTTTNAHLNAVSQSPSGTSSPLPQVPLAKGLSSDSDAAPASAIPPTKAAILKDAGAPVSPSPSPPPGLEPPKAAEGQAATISLPIAGAAAHGGHLGRPALASGASVNGNTWGGTGKGFTAGGNLARDPRAKARSRDYLKQCLQEITYLTSSLTLNPLPSTSQGAPGIPRPRKVLPEHVPPIASGVPGVLNLGPAKVPPLAPPGGEAVASAALAPAIQVEEPKQVSIAPPSILASASDPPSSFVPLKRVGNAANSAVGSVRGLPTRTAAAGDAWPAGRTGNTFIEPTLPTSLATKEVKESAGSGIVAETGDLSVGRGGEATLPESQEALAEPAAEPATSAAAAEPVLETAEPETKVAEAVEAVPPPDSEEPAASTTAAAEAVAATATITGVETGRAALSSSPPPPPPPSSSS